MFRFFVENSHSKYCCASLKGFRNFDETGIIFDREKEVVLSAKTHLSYDYDLKCEICQGNKTQKPAVMCHLFARLDAKSIYLDSLKITSLSKKHLIQQDKP